MHRLPDAELHKSQSAYCPEQVSPGSEAQTLSWPNTDHIRPSRLGKMFILGLELSVCCSYYLFEGATFTFSKKKNLTAETKAVKHTLRSTWDWTISTLSTLYKSQEATVIHTVKLQVGQNERAELGYNLK